MKNDVLALSKLNLLKSQSDVSKYFFFVGIWYDEIILLTFYHIFLCKYDINCDINVPAKVVPLQKFYFGQLNEGEKIWMFQNNIVFNLSKKFIFKYINLVFKILYLISENCELQVVVFNAKVNQTFNCMEHLDGIPVKISFHGRILFICTNRGSVRKIFYHLIITKFLIF